MPDYQPVDVIERIRKKSVIQPPGIPEMAVRGSRCEGPLRICWAARWEHDKNPETFFEAIEILKSKGIDFRLSVIGEQFRDKPAVFEKAADAFKAHIDRWGYQATREEYEGALREADVIVSTAVHEFFGISVVEAMAAGAYPLLPRRLAYPEILDVTEAGETDAFFYDGSARGLADRLASLAERPSQNALWQGHPDCLGQVARKYFWPTRADELDAALEETVRLGSES
jgi:glycosyltransferase involved in cell wall biosynthesis